MATENTTSQKTKQGNNIYIYIYIQLPAIMASVHMYNTCAPTPLLKVHMYWLNVQGLRVKAFVVCCVMLLLNTS